MATELLVSDRQVVVPGEELVRGMDYIPGQGTYRLGDSIYAMRVGLVTVEGRAIKLIALSGRYMPKKNDTVIVRVIDILIGGWRLDTNSAYSAMLSMKDATSEFIPRGSDLSQFFTFGDHLVVKIVNVTSQNLIDVTLRGPGLRKLDGGRILHVVPDKVPRIIGKKGSMVSMMKQATNSKIVVGQNGVIWLAAEDPLMEIVAVDAIRMIERNSHLKGLTDAVKKFLEEKTGVTVTEGGAE